MRDPAAYDIHLAAPAELVEAAQLYERVANETLYWLPPASQTAARFLQYAQDETVWVATAGGRVIGLAALYEPESFLHSLYVDAAWRDRGVGLALLDHVAARAAGPLSLKAQARNLAALRFYAREGFREEKRGEEDGAVWILLTRRALEGAANPI